MEAARVAQLNPTPEELAYTPSHPSEWTFFYLYFFEHALVLAVESGDPINFENALALYTQIQSGDRVHFSASDPNSSYSAYIVISASTRARLAGAFAPYLPSSQ
jgi:hypothetical protein